MIKYLCIKIVLLLLLLLILVLCVVSIGVYNIIANFIKSSFVHIELYV